MTTTPDPARIDWAAAIPTNRKPPPEEGVLERLERQHRERAARRLAQLALDEVPARYADATPDHPEVRRWLDGLLARQHTDGLTLLGGVGRGKTHQAFGAYRLALMGGVVPGAWLHVPTWLESQRPNRTAAAEHSGSPARARLLVVDDLGAERGSEWTVEAVYRLIDSRWRQALPTLVTSNLVPDQLRQLLGDRVVSRLAGMGPTVVLDGPDYPDRRRVPRVMDTPPA